MDIASSTSQGKKHTKVNRLLTGAAVFFTPLRKQRTYALLAYKGTLAHFVPLLDHHQLCPFVEHSVKRSSSQKMELELGLKISKTVDGSTSSTDLLIAKDRSGPLFLSRETYSMFILTAHLKGLSSLSLWLSIHDYANASVSTFEGVLF